MTKSLTFYTNPMSRGQIVRWMLEEVGEPYEERVLEYGAGMKSPEYLALNPMGKVPTVVHGERVITECAAICLYLADAFPAKGLAPALDDRADYYRWTVFAAGPVEQAVTNKSMGWAVDDPQKEGTLGYGSYDRTVSVLSTMLENRDYICGDKFTATDVYVGSTVDWGVLFKTLPSTPSFEAYIARIREREAYKRAKARDQELIAAQQATKG